MGKLMLMHTMVPMDMVTMPLPTMVMDMVLDMHTMDTMDTHMLIMDITMARDLLMLMLMLTMVPMDMVLPTMVMDMVLPTMDMDMVLLTTDTHMLTMDTTTARDPLMLRLMPMLTTDTTHMPMDTMDTDTTLMATMDTMDTHMLMVTTDIINLFIFVKELRSL